MRFSIILYIIAVCTFYSYGQINPPEIRCIEVEAGTDNVVIQWDLPNNTCGPFISYEIWGSNTSGGPFFPVATINNQFQTTYTHTNALASNSTWYYYMQASHNCPGEPIIQSTVSTNLFSNETPDISNINITSSGIVLSWDTASHPQTAGYVINYLLPSGLAQPIDTIFGINNTSYTDIISNPDDPGLIYTLTLIDGCENQSGFNTTGFRPIIIQRTDIDRCDQTIQLEWAKYINPYNDSYQYDIYASVNGSADSLYARQDSLETQFNFFDFNDGDTIVFMIEVVLSNGDVVTNSASLEIIATVVQPPSDFYITNIRVNDFNQIELYYYIDTLAELINFTVENGSNASDLDLVERYNAVSPLIPFQLYIDSISDPTENAWYYQMTATDSCSEDHLSTIGRSVFLTGKLEDFFVNQISWNAFELEYANVVQYEIYRDYGAGFQLIETVDPSTQTLSDPVHDLYTQQGTFCYRVEAVFTLSLPNGIVLDDQVATSNVFCLKQRPLIHVPNAIIPSGINNEFKPVIIFGGSSDYSMKIFNRWGEQLFESNHPDIGWPATKNGELVPTGGYPYIISFTAIDGTPVERKGIVSVIR